MIRRIPNWVAFGSGRFAPARFAWLALAHCAPGLAQQTPPPAQSLVPIPDALELNKLVWSTIAAVDDANKAGNYSVLRDLSAPAFQQQNDSARLAQIFQSLRESGVDLSNALLLAPTFGATPQIAQPGVLHVQGFFGLRPTAIAFNLYYQWSGGRWRLYGVSISPATISNVEPGATLPPAPKPKQVDKSR